MFVKQFRTGGDRNFGYLAADEQSREAFLVDVSYNPHAIAAFALERGYIVRYLFSTHGHTDHTNGNAVMERLVGLRPLLYKDACPNSRITVVDGAVFPLGRLSVEVLHTPGHTADSICLYAGGALFTGDTLFVGKVGGTWSEQEARAEYESLHGRILRLPPETMVYPGHDYGLRPSSTLGEERASNPFLLQPDFDSFLSLKNNWAAYKKAHGIA